MKSTLFLMMIFLLLSCSQAIAKPFDEPYGEAGLFYSSLSPYGGWVRMDFGYAWRPHYISHGWRPYMYGRWAWTDYGWYWVSNEPFGWATYHYGRWEYDDYYGWIWIPDDVWGPAWVEWRYNDDYIGWAPLPPQATFNVDVGISFTDNWAAPVYYWNFVPCRYMTATRVVDYVQPIENTRRFFGTTRGSVGIRSDGDRVVNRGIDVGFVERRGNIRVGHVDVVQRETGSGERFVREANRDRVEVFRPRPDRLGRGELAPPSVGRGREEQTSPGKVESGRPNRDWQSGRAPARRDMLAVPPSVRDTRPRDISPQEPAQQRPGREWRSSGNPQNQRPPEIRRDAQRPREMMRDAQRPPVRQQMQPERRGERQVAPHSPSQGRQQRDDRNQERKPRP